MCMCVRACVRPCSMQLLKKYSTIRLARVSRTLAKISGAREDSTFPVSRRSLALLESGLHLTITNSDVNLAAKCKHAMH